MLLRVVLAVAAALAILPACAWGPAGHRQVARVAQAHLTPAARHQVQALLALEPGATLESVADWADRARAPGTVHWHFVNLPRGSGCRYSASRDCPGGDCVVAAIDAQRLRLVSSVVPAERLQALKYLVHLVGDVHQPLHAGHADDRGGNTYQLQAFGRGSNLHRLWDAGLQPPRDVALDEGRGAPPLPVLSAGAGSSPAEWARESCRIVDGDGFYPGRVLTAAYRARYAPAARRRVQVAGLRLAGLLNDTLGHATESR